MCIRCIIIAIIFLRTLLPTTYIYSMAAQFTSIAKLLLPRLRKRKVYICEISPTFTVWKHPTTTALLSLYSHSPTILDPMVTERIHTAWHTLSALPCRFPPIILHILLPFIMLFLSHSPSLSFPAPVICLTFHKDTYVYTYAFLQLSPARLCHSNLLDFFSFFIIDGWINTYIAHNFFPTYMYGRGK